MVRHSVRPATEEDLTEAQAVARRTIDACYRSFLGNESVDSYIDSGQSDAELKQHLANLHVMTENDVVVGFTIIVDNLVHLMMVDESRHREGLGSHLLRYAERQLFTDHNLLRLNTFDGNEQAISFYLSNGWNETHSEEDSEHGFVRRFFEKRRWPAGDAA